MTSSYNILSTPPLPLIYSLFHHLPNIFFPYSYSSSLSVSFFFFLWLFVFPSIIPFPSLQPPMLSPIPSCPILFKFLLCPLKHLTHLFSRSPSPPFCRFTPAPLTLVHPLLFFFAFSTVRPTSFSDAYSSIFLYF